MSTNKFPLNLSKRLTARQTQGTLRSLKQENNLIDFCSNDYLGFARSEKLLQNCFNNFRPEVNNGSGGSRLLKGNHTLMQEVEEFIAGIHNAEAGLIFNSGYNANFGLLSCIATRHDTIIYDELSHASIIDGARHSLSKSFSFKHNNTEDLELKLRSAEGNKFVVVESIYSMDGDQCPLKEIAEIAKKHNAYLIVDEAHAIGVAGKKGLGLVDEFNLQHDVFARVNTFGKALGVHGAIVLGSKELIEYLVNFSRPFIYTTALPHSSFIAIKEAYKLLLNSETEIEKLRTNISLYKKLVGEFCPKYLTESESAIQPVILGDNNLCRQKSELLSQKGLDVKPIYSPTVAIGSERLRICLHSYNTAHQIETLVRSIAE